LHRRLRRLTVLVYTLLGLALTLAIVAISLSPPLVLLALPPLWLVWRETSSGGLLDPDPLMKGIRGERTVREVLDGLDGRFRVHHDLDTGRGNVDHVVIGPTGIFAIETKNRSGSFEWRHGMVTVNGRDARDILRQAVAEAMAVRDRLRGAGIDQWVEAVVVAVGPVQHGHLEADNVTVRSVGLLRPFILNRQVKLSSAEVERADGAIVGSGIAAAAGP